MLPSPPSQLTDKEVAVLGNSLLLWTKNIIELLEKLKDTNPESSGMLAEIYYWRDMSRVLDAVAEELKSTFVDQTVDVLRPHFEIDVKKFTQ